MSPRVLQVDRTNPDPAAIADASELLLAGGLVAFPTETVYGLGANALDDDAVRRIFAAKGRPATNPIIVHVDSAARARALAADWPDAADALAAAFWPGPLTLVVGRGPQVAPIVSAGLDTFGVRVPAHPVALRLLSAAGVPIAAPSANRYTEVSPTTAAHVTASLGDRVDLILDAGPTDVGIESTVVHVDRTGVSLLRPGQVSLADLERVVGRVRRAIAALDDDVARPSPGQSVRHYAPRARVAIGRWGAVEPAGVTGALLFDSDEAPGAAFVVQMPREPASYAQRLYAAFWEADAASCDLLVVEPPPQTPQWEAIHDRLHRAHTPP